MERKRNKHKGADRALHRRDALKGLGALAVSLPALASLSCGSESEADDEGEKGQEGDRAASTSGSGKDAGSAPGNGTKDAGGGGGANGVDAGGKGGAGGTSVDAGMGKAQDAQTPNAGDAAGPSDASQVSAADAASSLPSDVMFEDATSCTLTATDRFGEGPFLITEEERMDDISMIRSDIRDGHPGCEFRLHFRILNAKNNCAPISGAEVYIWHCDADGFYSGFGNQNPAVAYSGGLNPPVANAERFCRGVQSSDSRGIVGFTTVYPGWYAGRPIHVHLLIRLSGATKSLLTTQLYFPRTLTDQVHGAEPRYMARFKDIPDASANPPAPGSGSGPTVASVKYMPGSGLAVGTLNVIVNQS